METEKKKHNINCHGMLYVYINTICMAFLMLQK